MRAWTLGSGSSGNALVLESGGRRLLVDCGFGPRALATRLKAVGIAPESIEAVLVTHEHTDHASGLERAQHKWRWPVHAAAGTLAALPGVAARWRRPVAAGEVAALDAFTLEAVAVPHDAAAPLAFVVTATASGARVGVAHDLGRVPAALRAALMGCDALCVEANHDVVMLREGPYPRMLQERISGGRGHLSNDECAALVRDVMHPGLGAIVLLHLSEVNNAPAIAERTVGSAARKAGYRGSLRAAARRSAEVAFDLDARRGPLPAPVRTRTTAASQLDLGL